MRFTALMKTSWLSVLGDAITNGTLVIYGGTPPAVPGDTPQSAFVIAELHVASISGVSEDGAIEIKLRSGEGRVTGTPTWFQVRDLNGRIAADGEVGREPGQLQIDPPQVMQGGRVDGVKFVFGW